MTATMVLLTADIIRGYDRSDSFVFILLQAAWPGFLHLTVTHWIVIIVHVIRVQNNVLLW